MRYATSKVLHREIAYEINKSIKFIPRRGKSIAEWLVNAKKIARNEHFTCAGPPWCDKQNHFTRDLADMEGICAYIGQRNANLIPENTSNNYQYIIESWLKKLL